jgi:lipopolysaccharide export system permease protein
VTSLPFAKRIDRYLAGRFLMGMAIVFFTCVGLILLVDFVEMLRRTGDREGASVFRVLWLCLLRLPTFTEILFPFAVLFGTMIALLRLSQKLELVVVRAAGQSVWQFMVPGLLIALGIGLFGTFAYNPMAATAKEMADRIESQFFGARGTSALQAAGGSVWLRQDGIDGQFILSAGASLEAGLDLRAVSIHIFDRTNAFIERVDAARAELRDGYWRLTDALVMRIGEEPETYGTYLVATHLTPDQVRESLGSVETISFYDLPRYIELSERAGLPATRLRLQYQVLLARPWLLTAMALIAATVSLRLFRLGIVLPLVLGGVTAGFLLYVAMEVARQVGRSGAIGDVWAAWTPVVVASLIGLTVLLHQEDG